jgi:hypothetical protein
MRGGREETKLEKNDSSINDVLHPQREEKFEWLKYS